MDRRSFVGSVLGLLAGSQAPFTVKEVEYTREDQTKLIKAKAYIRTFEISEAQLHKYKTYLVTPEGFKFWAPPVLTVDRDVANLKCNFKMQPLHAKREVEYKAVGLVTDCGIVMNGVLLSGSVRLTIGDVLHVSYLMSMGW